MIGIIVVTILLAWLGLVVWLACVAIENGSKFFAVLAFFSFSIPLGLLANASMENEKQNPCAQYETRMQFNPATKTMMPMRVCVLRGKWVEEEQMK